LKGPECREICRTLEAEPDHINGRFAEFDWVPINYLNKSYARQDLAGFERATCIRLVTPLHDGINLVAKEYGASQNPQDPGVLVLARFAGATRELDAALIANPFGTESVADAIARGLEIHLGERGNRWAALIEKLPANALTT
jgi:trehalose 6-phosphate synthase